MIGYFVSTSLGYAALFVLYKAVLGRLTYFSANRAVLIFGAVFVAIWPVLNVGLVTIDDVAAATGIYRLPAIMAYSSGAAGSSVSNVSWLGVLYGLGVGLFSLKAFASIGSTLKILASGMQDEMLGRKVVFIRSNNLAFSFFNFIAIPNGLEDSEAVAVLKHEGVHADQLHSVDRLVFNVLCCAFWFNPFVWLLNRELIKVHEFLADRESVKSVGAKVYGETVLNLAIGGSSHLACSSINSFSDRSIIKTRFSMMYSQRSSSASLLRYLFICPAFILTMLVSCVEGPLPITNSKVYDTVDDMPEYPGGFGELIEYMQSAIKYPDDAQAQGIEGKVYVSFVVNEDGSISDAKADNSVFPSIDAQAVEVVSTMKNWNAGTVNGDPVKVRLVLPITYLLKDGEEYSTPTLPE